MHPPAKVAQDLLQRKLQEVSLDDLETAINVRIFLNCMFFSFGVSSDLTCLCILRAQVSWILIGTCLVVFMQIGFSMLEVGVVQAKSTKSILVRKDDDDDLRICSSS